MPKRDVREAATDLTAFAAEAGLPTQHTSKPEKRPKPKNVTATPSRKPTRAAKKEAEEPRDEAQPRVAISMPEALQQELHIKAIMEKTSMRALILKALKDAGYNVRDEDLRDGRRALV